VVCQAEGRNLDTDITIIHKFKAGTPNERFLWNALKQAERRNKILQRNFIIMECEKDIIVLDYVTMHKQILLFIIKYKQEVKYGSV